LSLLFNDSR